MTNSKTEIPPQKKWRHNRKRNVGLIYEFLVRHLGQQLLEKNPQEFSRIHTQIYQKFFLPGSLLQEEKELFGVLQENKFPNNVIGARKFLGMLKEQALRANPVVLEKQKNQLIKEIHKHCGQEFFSAYRLPTYRLLGAFQILLENWRTGKSPSFEAGVNTLQLEEELIRYLSSSPAANKQENKNNFDSPVDNVVLTLAEKKFSQKYQNTLGESQKKTLQKWMSADLSQNKGQFLQYLQEEKRKIGKVLSESYLISKEVREDKILQEKLQTAIQNWQDFEPSEKNLPEFLAYQKLVEELMSRE